MNSRQQLHEIPLRGLGIQSAQADFVQLLQWFQPPGEQDGDVSLNRRDFIRGLARGVTLSALLGGGAALVRKPASRRETCVSDGICTQCAVLPKCGLPQALSARQAKSGD
jgi:hypothetical protein